MKVNEYASNPEQLQKDLEDILSTYEGYAKKMPNHSEHTDGYIKGLQELIEQGAKRYATSSENDINDLYELKISSMPVPFGTNPYYDGYADAYNDLWKLCFEGGFEVLGTVEDIKTKFNLR